MQQRLQKILSAAGVASRRAAETYITDGRVSVNGRLVDGEDTALNTGEIIELTDARLEFQTAGALELRTAGT